MAETEGSDEASESELLDKSLSVWKGTALKGRDQFDPIPLDLHTASSLGHCDYVKTIIIRQEVDLDRRNCGGWTALMYACYIGHDKIVSLLLEADVCVNIRNFKGQTPLMLAASCGNETVGYFLCHHGAELEARDERGWTALFHATYSGHQNMVRFLLQQGANMNAVEQSLGMTPFMEAASEGHEIIVQLFLQHGVNVNAKAYNGDTARSLALINGNMKIVSLIDNHVMPITSLRAEPGLEGDFASSDEGSLSRKRNSHFTPGLRGKVKGAEPSIRDGPDAIARLIDRSRQVETGTYTDPVVPKGYVTFPSEVVGSDQSGATKLSYRDVTSPISAQDYTLDCSTGQESLDVEDDSNAFSKTGALTIKSSSGSSGGLAAALGIRREDSLDSDEFPHDSSCGDSNLHDNSESSSSEDGVDENIRAGIQAPESSDLSSDTGNQVKTSTQNNSRVQITQNQSNKHGRHKSANKDSLTQDKVNEIEVMQNSVRDWINNVHTDPTPIRDNSPSPALAVPDNTSKLTLPGQFQESDVNASPKFSSHTVQACSNAEVQQKEADVVSMVKSVTKNAMPADFYSQENQFAPSFNSQGPTYQRESENTGFQARPHSQTFSSLQSDTIQGTIPTGPVTLADSDLTNAVSGLTLIDTGQAGSQSQYSSEEFSQQKAAPNSFQLGGSQHRVQQFGISNPAMSQPGISPSGISQSGIPHLSATQDFGIPTQELHIDTTTLSIDSAEAKTPTSESGNKYSKSVNPPPGFQVQYEAYQMFPPTLTPQQPSGNLGNDALFKRPGDFIEPKADTQPKDLASLLEQLSLSKHLATFEEQDVDLQVFLSLTDKDLKEIGIKLFGPRKKMTNAIARWHSRARPAMSDLEQVYADRLESEMQEMAEQLQMAYEQTERLKAQVKQEQQLRNVTETCLMEERAAWQHVQRIVMDTRQQCEDFKEAIRSLWQYISETKSRITTLEKSPRPIRGVGAGYSPDTKREEFSLDDKSRRVTNEKLPTESVMRKLDYYMQELQHLLGNITSNTDRLLGRNTVSQSPERGYT